MKTIRRSMFAALALVVPPFGALAQASAPFPTLTALPDMTAAAASAPVVPPAASGTGPRLRSASETGNRAVAPGDLHPERPVAPQISIPFGKKAPPPSKAEERVVRRGNPAASGGVDDAAARCDSRTTEASRASCRAGVARESKGNLPN